MSGTGLEEAATPEAGTLLVPESTPNPPALAELPTSALNPISAAVLGALDELDGLYCHSVDYFSEARKSDFFNSKKREKRSGTHAHKFAKKKSGAAESSQYLIYEAKEGKNSPDLRSDLILAILGSQFSPFDHATNVRAIASNLYGSKAKKFETPNDWLTAEDYDPEDVAAVCAERMVRGDADSNQTNFGVETLSDGAKKIISFDFDRCLDHQWSFSLKEIEIPTFIEPPSQWEFFDNLTGHRPYNYLDRGSVPMGGSYQCLPFNASSSEGKLIRRDLENPERVVIIQPLENVWPKRLEELAIQDPVKHQSVRRQHFMHLVFNTCIPEGWFNTMAKASLPRDLSSTERQFADLKVEDHQKHLKDLQRALLTSAKFRNDFCENFAEYQTKLIDKIEAYNRRHSKPSKPKHAILKIDLEVALDNLRRLRAKVSAKPVVEPELLDKTNTQVREYQYQDKLLELVAYLNMSKLHRGAIGVGEDKALDLKIFKLFNNLQGYLDRKKDVNPRIASEMVIFLRDIKAESGNLENKDRKEKFLSKVKKLEESLKTKALAYYKNEPQRALNNLKKILTQKLESVSAVEDLKVDLETLSNFLMNTVTHQIMDQFPVMTCMGQKVAHSAYGLTREQISQGVLDLVKEFNLAKFRKIYGKGAENQAVQAYQVFLNQIIQFSISLSAAEFKQLYQLVNKDLYLLCKDQSFGRSVNEWAEDKITRFEGELKSMRLSPRDEKIETLLRLAASKSSSLEDREFRILGKHAGAGSVFCGCAWKTNSLKCANALQALFKLKTQEGVEQEMVQQKRRETLDLFRKVLAKTTVSKATKQSQEEMFLSLLT